MKIEEFGFYDTIRLSNFKTQKCFSSLYNLYQKIPDTTGCLNNLTENKCCGAWCCSLQCPQLLYCEFLLIWNYISKHFSNDETYEILRRSMLNAVNSSTTKGCPLFNKKDKICSIHKVRPLACRVYGITPLEEFQKRYEKLKAKYKNDPTAKIKEQCSLVSVVGDREVTTEDTNKWWEELKKIECSIGINKNKIHDEVGGSYRTPHDHILLYTMPNNVLSGLSGIKMYTSYIDKIEAVDNIIKSIKGHFSNNAIKAS